VRSARRRAELPDVIAGLPMSIRLMLSCVVAFAIAGVHPSANAAAPSVEQVSEGPAFGLRADPRWASEINALLREVAQPITITIPAGTTPEVFLRQLCTGLLPPVLKSDSTEAGTRVWTTPCLRVTRDVRIKVTKGDTLEGLAVRNGLRRDDGPALRVQKYGSGAPIVLATPNDLAIDDVVHIPEAPMWTDFVADAARIENREALAAALARRVKCESQDADACLVAKGITLLNRGPVREPRAPDAPIEFSRMGTDAVATLSAVDRAAAIVALPAAVPSISAPTAAPAPPPPPPLPVAAGAPHSAAGTPALDAASVPVDPKQWPYDIRQLAAIFRSQTRPLAKTAIGIADSGLATKFGGPFPPDFFAPGSEKLTEREGPNDPPEPDGIDDDRNQYDDDLFGAGVRRGMEIRGTGHLGLCDGPDPSFASWGSRPLSEASHGTIVSSMAAARPLRSAAPDIAAFLPKLVFFRMFGSVCTDDTNRSIQEAEMVEGFDYLQRHDEVGVINISYTIDQSAGKRFALTVKELIPQRNKLLVVPAGNHVPQDLDTSGICPACLGHSSVNRGGTASKRTVVVGAATRDLRRSSFSNFGRQTVWLFAPDELVGAIDLAEQPVPTATDAATSYAAPLVALAASIIRSFDPGQSPLDLKDRIAASVWPLDDAASGPADERVGVLDLLKAAAVRHSAVEVIEQTAVGSLVRHTYVGKLQTPLKALSLCAGQQFSEAAIHAIRLGPAAADGERTLRFHTRTTDDDTQQRLIETMQCRPQGDLQIETLLDGLKTFPLTDVTHIQLRWLLKN
jgi:hypothetical protein